jgi:deazaflavin-dependent oxidoreductase (nitroreductase family)
VAEEPIDPASGWTADHTRRDLATNGADGHIWRGAPTLLLTTRGRRSGRLRRTPLIYGRDGDAYLVVASRGGSDDPPRWSLNLEADPHVTIQVADRVIPGTARSATPEERPRLWEVMAGIWPDYRRYQTRTEREIPVIVIEPSGD